MNLTDHEIVTALAGFPDSFSLPRACRELVKLRTLRDVVQSIVDDDSLTSGKVRSMLTDALGGRKPPAATGVFYDYYALLNMLVERREQLIKLGRLDEAGVFHDYYEAVLRLIGER